MIWLYTGVPGSSKSLSVMRDVLWKLRSGGRVVIVNMIVQMDGIEKALGKKRENIKNLILLNKEEFTPQWCMDYAIDNHVPDKENQTLLIVDEAQDMFSPKVMTLKEQEGWKYYRVDWHDFWSKHRHFGYNAILVVHVDKWIDAQFRQLIQHETVHKILSEMGVPGFLAGLFAPKGKLFMLIEKDYQSGMVLGKKFRIYQKKLGAMYKSNSRFYQELENRRKKSLVISADV